MKKLTFEQTQKESKMTRTIEVSEETYAAIKDQLQADERNDLLSLNDMIGKAYFFRTVTYHILGKVDKIVGNIAVLSLASWVADSGRFMNAIKDGTLKEVEPLGSWNVNLQAVTDFGEWKHKLPTSQK